MPPTLKRRPSSDTVTVTTASDEPSPKKQKLVHPTRPPPAFWDNLSDVPLIASALRELDRRNNAAIAAASPHTPTVRPHPPHRPLTRRAASEQKKLARTSLQLATEYLASPSSTELRKIRSFARQGGPNLSHLRAHHYEPTVIATGSGMSSSSNLRRRKRGSASLSKKSTLTSQASTKCTGPYDRAFQQHLIDHGIYPDGYEYSDGNTPPPPDNLNDILQVLARPRPSLSPSRFSDADFRRFKRADTHAAEEWQLMSTVLPIIEGEVGDTKYVSGQIPFTNLDHLTDGSLVHGNPDRYYGARPEQLHQQVRADLNRHIVPSTEHDLPIVPNFFLAVKSPNNSPAVAERQACYDGALGARGIRSLQTYGGTELDPNGKASTITSTYQKGFLRIYTSHPLPPAHPGASGSGYIMTQVDGYFLRGNADAFRTGAAAFRNARDWAKKVRDEAIKKTNETLARNEHGTSATPDDLALSFALVNEC